MEYGHERVLTVTRLLSENDQKALAQALRKHQEITLERTLGDRTVIAKTIPVSFPWDVPMIVQVKIQKYGSVQLKNFERAEDAVVFGNTE